MKILISVMFILFVVSCGGSKETAGTKTPKWITKPGLYEDVIVAAGLGEGLTEQKAKSQAELDGRKKIAQTLQSQVKSLTTNFMEEAGTTTEQGSETAAQEYFSEITQSMTDVTLSGATLEEYWPPMGEKTGNKMKIYAKMVLKKSALIDQFKKQVQADIAQKKIKNVKASADAALKALDNAVGKWEKTADKED